MKPSAAVLAFSLAAIPLATPTAEAKAPAAESYVCTQIMGVSVTGDWYNAGFEDGVDNDRFQALWRKHAFIELWGDPKNELWAEKVTSPCKDRANNPDRVVFTGVNWEWKTLEQWTDAFSKVVKTISAKYPGVKRIDLITMLRAPKNVSCGDAKTVVAPYIDEAIAKVAAANPKLVVVGPKVETPSCNVFVKGGPHFSPEGMAEVAKIYAKAFTPTLAAKH
jgi:hypothetical protein